MMNKKTFVSICAVFALAFIITSVIVLNNLASAFRPSLAMPSEGRYDVSGNGGNAVIVGEYLYFVGSYTDVNTLGRRDNRYNKTWESGIYRVRLAGGAPVYEIDDGKINIYRPENVELVVPKVAGFINSSLFVSGDYLIYTSPNNERDSSGELQRNKIDFYRVSLNGKNHKHIYTTSSVFYYASTEYWTVVQVDGEPYLLVNDNSTKLVCVSMSGKVTKFADEVTKAVFPKVSSYFSNTTASTVDASFSGIMSYVYYVEAKNSEDLKYGESGNLLKRFDIKNKTTEIISKNQETGKVFSGIVYDVLALANGKLLYTETVGTVNAKPVVYMTSDENVRDTYELADFRNTTSSDTYYMPNEVNNVASMVVRFTGNKFIVYREESGYVPMTTIESVSSIVSVTSTCIIYINSDNNVVKLDARTCEQIGAQIELGDKYVSDARVTALFIRGVGDRVFYLETFGSGEDTITRPRMTCFSNNADTSGEEGKPKTSSWIVRTVEDDYIA